LKTLAIVGAGGHGRVVAEIATRCGWTDIVFFDDRFPTMGQTGQWPVIGNCAALEASIGSYAGIHIAIGDNCARFDIFRSLPPVELITLIDPSATLSASARLGFGVCIMAGVIINAGARISDGVVINTGATVDHDCWVGGFAHICPGASLAGGVQVGIKSQVGIGSVIIQNITIGDSVVVGAGSVVVSNVPSGTLVYGAPAKISDGN
jgi:sugar O-acyltransferase (sialic acid O-acetyltransferase NeuD family)